MSINESDVHDHGLTQDAEGLLRTSLPRRRVLQLALATGASVFSSACTSANTAPNTTIFAKDGESCIQSAEETAGPFPSDGSNRIDGTVSNVLSESGVVRSDITRSFGGSNTQAGGIPLTFTMKLVNVNDSCATLEGYAIYLWHCTQDGAYSLYSRGVENENFLRGVQISDSNGELTFKTIVPGCYPGRFPHLHFEVYPNFDQSTRYTDRIQSSQLAVPRAVCEPIYNTADGYKTSIKSLARITLEKDGVFRNNSTSEIEAMTLTLSGNVSDGYTGTITIGVPA